MRDFSRSCHGRPDVPRLEVQSVIDVRRFATCIAVSAPNAETFAGTRLALVRATMGKQEESAMETAVTTTTHDESVDQEPNVHTADRTIEVDGAALHIRGLKTERPSIVGYLSTIAPSKQEIALLHALEVGITELAVRRERFRS